jgi:CTD kinase subunit beta
MTHSALAIAHAVIDLLIQSAQNHSVNTSPRTPSSPSPHPSPRNSSALPHVQSLVVPYKADQLIRLKIVMRESEHPPRPRQPLGSADPSALYGGHDSSLLGRNEGTVRFLFGPPGIVGHGV